MVCDLGTILAIVIIIGVLANAFPILRRTITYVKFTGPAAIILIIIAWYLICGI
ncbi:MAG: hypothetical protein ACTSR2_02305 [Candidatus Hodarchaeales archaeon]